MVAANNAKAIVGIAPAERAIWRDAKPAAQALSVKPRQTPMLSS